MRKLVSSALAGLALVGTAIGAAAPADARGWHGGGYYHGGYRGWGGGGAVAAGIIGLGVGAALASRPYYGPGYGYGYAPGYYAYGAPYYAGDYCRTDWRWDGWRGRYLPVRYCY